MNYGTGPLPYDSDAPGAPQNTIPGGASLWVFGDKSDETYKGVAAFFEFLSQTAVQEYLHQTSGYLPVTMAAYEATKASGFYEKNPGREQPIIQMMGKAPTENSRGVRLVNLPQVRDIQNEEFENMLAGKQTAQQALDNAVARGNEAISQALGQLRSRWMRAVRSRPAARRAPGAASRPRMRGRSRLQSGSVPESDDRVRPRRHAPGLSTSQRRMPHAMRRATLTSCMRATFPHRLLPYLLVAPQLAISLVFFYWPAARPCTSRSCARTRSASRPSSSASPTSAASSPTRPTSTRSEVTVVFSFWTAFLSMAIALLLAVQAEKILRGKGFYRTLLIWPYAVAAAIAGMLWLFLFNPSFGTLAWPLRQLGIAWDPLLQRRPGHGARHRRRRLEADQLQLPLLRRRPAGDPEIAARGRRDRRRRPGAAASGPSSSRCWRRPPSSCWWSTPSTRSSTPSASSTP